MPAKNNGGEIRTFTAVFPVIVCSLILSSCSMLNKFSKQNENISLFSDKAILLELPFEAQKKPNLCGLASVEMLTRYYGIRLNDVQRNTLIDEAEKNQGITGTALKTVLEEAGYFVAVFPGTLDHESTGIYRHLDSRRPLMLMLEAENDKANHYVILTGYDPERDIIIISDPGKGRIVMSLDNFKKRWELLNNFALLAIPANMQ
ncbi:MAG: papain-like cysteine protease family protein [bacterium]|nr:papain-like cysteine protease family protein [bacterium]